MTTITATTQLGVALYQRWASMWNGEVTAEALMAPRFTLRYAQVGAEHFNRVSDPAEFDRQLADFRAARPGIRYSPQGPAVVDMTAQCTGYVAQPYLATIPGLGGDPDMHISGTDILRAHQNHIVEVWSVSAPGQPFYS